jgi:hypothetical protein
MILHVSMIAGNLLCILNDFHLQIVSINNIYIYTSIISVMYFVSRIILRKMKCGSAAEVQIAKKQLNFKKILSKCIFYIFL